MPNQFKMSMEEYCEKWNRNIDSNLVIALLTDHNLDGLISQYEDEEFWGFISQLEYKYGEIEWTSRPTAKNQLSGICAKAQEVVDAHRTAISIVKGL